MQNMINKVVATFCLTTLATLVHATPIYLSLRDPCGGSKVAMAPGWTGRPVAARNITFKDVANSALESAEEARILQQKYLSNDTNTLISSSLGSVLDTTHLPNLSYTRSNTDNMSLTLQTDYSDVARIAVYMENVLQHDNRSSVKPYIQEKSSFVSSLRNTLCKIKLAADSHGEILSESIGDNTIPEDCRQISSLADRYCRDYIIFKDAEEYLSDIVSDYSSYSESQ